MIQKLEPRHFGPDSGFGGATFSDVIDKVNEIIDAMNGKQKKQKPISSCDIVPYIDEKIAALQDMWREEKVSFDWDDMKDMIEDVARHFYHKEQKPSTGIYWHAIKRGEKLPCRAYIWNPDYEKYHDCWEGRLIPNLENISVGGDTWYLPADDVKNLPREGLDELQKEQKPNSTEDMPYIADERFYEREPADSFKYKLAEHMTKCCTKKEGQYGYTYGISAESILKMAEEELLKRGVVQKPAEWSEEDKKILDDVSHILIGLNYKQIAKDYKQAVEKLIYARPSWKPSEDQMDALLWCIAHLGGADRRVLAELYEHLKMYCK